ncbi:MAG: bifunctional sulfate adenylyltransferase subunit 1/adenylylsulfate kinase [Balneola sp.]|nr:bifunctional sulfate adenylyltransferase subunit 1/adenylylsulfate kinase [Balneola sp.]MBE80477.1 bifunctional sulfate adenylyltransferase subunit 1/adenylylsulfate kinase [Balneola sp.]|tara:strand:- start:767 stop:2701 length:1935 start_codon:yes stop_codon:yes gene_type:complete
MSSNNGDKNNPNTDNKYLDMDMLRFTTAGSVDDGKSTLIGRLFYDSKSIFEDQMEAIEKSSKSSGEEDVNLALLTDGLKAEREQKITIDVAYRYFATPKRKFIIADTPGHTQYTRNMVTGASTADLAIILVDASKGLLTQSRRHAFISSLLRIPHLVVAVNKMDLVDYDEEVFDKIVSDFRAFAKKLNVSNVTYIPISALKGDNVVDKSENTEWYNGSTLLHHLETVKVDASDNIVDFRLPVQYVIRPNQNFRGFSGRIASGHIRPGDEIKVLPSGLTSKVKEIVTRDENLDIAYPGDSVTLTIEDEIDISRGDMIVRKNNVPMVSNELEAYLCWMNEKDLELNKQYILQHNTRTVQVFVEDLIYRINVDSLSREDSDSLSLNEIGRVKLKTSKPIFYDPYQVNQKTGSFIIIDPASNVTIGAGMIRAGSTESGTSDEADAEALIDKSSGRKKSPNVVWEPWNIPRELREKRNGHKSKIIWFTGISGAGKSTIAKEVERKLWEEGKQTVLLDGDQVRHGLNGDLGFSASDRTENIRRVGEVARLFYEHGNIVLCTFVSPYVKDREEAKELFPDGEFQEVHIKCDPKTAQERDPKGLYKKAEEGEITGLTGYDADYEASDNPALTINTDELSVEEAVEKILELMS